MTKSIRPAASSFAAAALVLFLPACGGGNSPSTVGTGGAGSASGGASGTASGGTSGTASGGASGTKSGGSSGSSGGSTGAGGGAFGEPACLSTVSKGAACSATDQQLCYKTCGPEKTGVKWEKCETSGMYAEMSGCTFDPTRNFACYKIPTTANAACPAGVTPQASMPCDVPQCTSCNSMQGVTGGLYLDSSGSMKTGWCTCQEASAAGTRSWTCASDTAWPCPQGAGC